MFMEDLLGAGCVCSRAEHPLVPKADRSPALMEPTFQSLPLQRGGNGRGGELGQFQDRF